MKKLIYIFTIILILMFSSCQHKSAKDDNKIFYENHAYDIIKLNDTTFMSVPTGMMMDADTIRCQIFKL